MIQSEKENKFMTKIAILPEVTPTGDVSFHAFSGEQHSVGRTAGEALDKLTRLFPAEQLATLVIVQNFRPDRFFSELQQRRLGELMDGWRTARKSGTSLPPQEESELRTLVDQELQAATDRAAELIKELDS
jgi:hypothetical protein